MTALFRSDVFSGKSDYDRLVKMLSTTQQNYANELRAIDHVPPIDQFFDLIISVLTLGLANRARQRSSRNEIGRRLIHEKYARLIDSIGSELSRMSLDLAQLGDLEEKYAIILKDSFSSGGYPGNWEEVSMAVRTRDGFRCNHPGCCRTDVVLHVHHVIPLSKGGSNQSSNLVTLCAYHHTMKHPHMRQ